MKKKRSTLSKIVTTIIFVVAVFIAIDWINTEALPYFTGNSFRVIPDPIKVLPDDHLYIDYEQVYMNTKTDYIAKYYSITEESFNKYIDICVKKYFFKIEDRDRWKCRLTKGRWTLFIDMEFRNGLHIWLSG